MSKGQKNTLVHVSKSDRIRVFVVFSTMGQDQLSQFCSSSCRAPFAEALKAALDDVVNITSLIWPKFRYFALYIPTYKYINTVTYLSIVRSILVEGKSTPGTLCLRGRVERDTSIPESGSLL